MADWYVSSAVYASVAAWAATTAYTVGQLIKPLTLTQANRFVYRCTTAGTTAGTEPNWATAIDNNTTITSGTAVFTNVSGQSAYGWSAAAGNLFSISTQIRNILPVVGDRVFVSSDHSESLANIGLFSFSIATIGFGNVQIISVNRAGSVPPVAADIQSGATVTTTAGNLTFEAYIAHYYQGITFTVGGGATNFSFYFGSSTSKAYYFKNCAFVISNTNINSRFSAQNVAQVIFDNTTVQFGNVSQRIALGGYGLDLTWLNTPSAIQGATLPTVLFSSDGYCMSSAVCRGVDLSAITGTLVATGSFVGYNTFKTLLDSCRINPGVTRYSTSANAANFEVVELINCFDGTNIINERHTPAGDVTIDRSVTLSGGARDDVGTYSLKLISSTRADKAVMPLESFWLDVENALIGASKTATVEIISAASLNNDDIQLMLEYMGTSGSALASFGNSLATVLTAAAALASSSSSWTVPGTSVFASLNPQDVVSIALSNNNLTATGTATNCGVRGVLAQSVGKYYWEYTVTTSFGGLGIGVASASSNLITYGGNQPGNAVVAKNGSIYVNGVASGSGLGSISASFVIGVAVDFTAALIWFRVAPSGNWNGSGTANPATGIGGISISSIGLPLFPSISLASGDVTTANFGASAFTGTVPSGFASGISLIPTVKQLLQVTFTPQVAGRVRGLVRVGRNGALVNINPQIAIA